MYDYKTIKYLNKNQNCKRIFFNDKPDIYSPDINLTREKRLLSLVVRSLKSPNCQICGL